MSDMELAVEQLKADRRDRAIDVDAETAERVRHYSFRLFLRGAIQRRSDFAPREATRYLSAAQEKGLADALVEVGTLVRTPRNHCRFLGGSDQRRNAVVLFCLPVP